MTKEEAAKVAEEAASDSDSESEDETVPGRGKLGRAEKKARKAMLKLGMKAVPGVDRVTIRKNKNTVFTIATPDVFKSPAADTYVIFGEAKIEDMQAMMQKEAALQMAKAQAQAATESKAEASGTAEEAEDDEQVDETGLDPKDVDLIISQAGVSRAKAVRALRKTDGDLVSAIMELTM